jgi:hypothetical protein
MHRSPAHGLRDIGISRKGRSSTHMLSCVFFLENHSSTHGYCLSVIQCTGPPHILVLVVLLSFLAARSSSAHISCLVRFLVTAGAEHTGRPERIQTSNLLGTSLAVIWACLSYAGVTGGDSMRHIDWHLEVARTHTSEQSSILESPRAPHMGVNIRASGSSR